MENRNQKNLLKYLKENNIIRLYQIVFDKYIDLDRLYAISEKSYELIMCENEYESVINLYEALNNTKINERIRNYILKINDKEIKKYCMRLSISEDFVDEDKKLDYIKALSESNSDAVRFAYGIASSKLYIDSEDGIEYVEIIGKCNSDVVLPLINILHSEKYRNDEDLLPFVKLIKDVDKDYIAEYMVDLFKNEDSHVERVHISYISILMSSKGIKQASLVHKLLCDEEMVKREDITINALLIASSDDEERAYVAYKYVLENKSIEEDNITDEIFNIINKDIVSDKIKVKSK